MDYSPALIKPKVSLWSQVRRYGRATSLVKNKDKGKQTGPSEDEGKLAALMNITLDVFFEVQVHIVSRTSFAKGAADCIIPEASRFASALLRLEEVQSDLHEQVRPAPVGRRKEE